MAPIHVLIAGAGIGGLALAQALRKQGISFEIFDRDESENSRRQGWAIGLHSVVDDLRASVPEEMPSLDITNHLLPLDLPAQFVHFSPLAPGRNGVQADSTRSILRASRRKLRQWLTIDIPIQFNKWAYRITEHENGVTVYFKDGTHATGDVLVGSDGVNSVVRQHLLGEDNILRIVPCATISGEITLYGDAVKRQLEIAHSAWLADSIDENGTPVRLFVGLDSINVDEKAGDYYWSVLWTDDTVTQQPHWTQDASPDELYMAACKKMENIPANLREILDLSGPQSVMKHQVMYRDIEITSLPAGRVTILGDAAHPMTPFRGEGGVHALTDALNLSRYLTRMVDKADTKEILRLVDEYHKEMLPRGADAVRNSRNAFSAKLNPVPFAWGHKCWQLPENKVEFPITAPNNRNRNQNQNHSDNQSQNE